jgi:hypothetical protein
LETCRPAAEISRHPKGTLISLAQDITALRLHNLGLSHPWSVDPAGVVARLAAVQAQDYYGAQWALGGRLAGAGDHDIEDAFNQGGLLRTHLLRPTWHFVTPDDIVWLLKLTGPRVQAASAYRYRQLELEAGLFKRSDSALAEALADGMYLTRNELGEVLEAKGIPQATGQRLAYLVMHAELEAVICSGPRRGKQFTYALLDDRLAGTKRLSREQGLAELAGRYFATRGPASVRDFAKWSGLTLKSAREGHAAIRVGLAQISWDGQDLWFPDTSLPPTRSSSARLLSIFDEYLCSYADRSAIIDDGRLSRLWAMGAALRYVIALDGRIVGTWKRTLERQAVLIELSFFDPPSRVMMAAVAREAERYAAFLGRMAVVSLAGDGRDGPLA